MKLLRSGRVGLAASTASVAAAGLLVGACSPAPRQSYSFEAQPRAVISESGPSELRFARVALDPVSSPTAYVLAAEIVGERSRIVLLMSENGGDSFGPAVPVSAAGENAGSHGEDSPSLIVSPGPYAAWDQNDDIRFARSRTWGASFETPIRIRDKPGDYFSGYVSLAASAAGDLYAVWLDTRDSAKPRDTTSVYLARSSDGGEHFGANVRVAEAVCECCRPGVDFGPNGEVLVFFRGKYPGDGRDMTVAVSRDRGASFEAPRRIASENWMVRGCPDSGITTARLGPRVYAAWLSEPSKERSGIQLTYTDDAAAHWAPTQLASQEILDANYPALASADDGRVALIFQGREPRERNGWSSLTPFVVAIDADGRVSRPQPVPGVSLSAMRPSLGLGSGQRLFAAWTAVEAGKTQVQVSRARKTS